MSLARLGESVQFGAHPRWMWIGADALAVYAVFSFPILLAALFDPAVLRLAFGIGWVLCIYLTIRMEQSDPNDWDKVSDWVSRQLLPGSITLGVFVGWWLGLLWAAFCGIVFVATVKYSRP